MKNKEVSASDKLDIMGHTLGVNVYHAMRSELKKDKRLPKQFYRNHFCAGKNCSDIATINELISSGYMASGKVINDGEDTLYYVTEAGIKIFRIWFNAYIGVPILTSQN